MSEAPAGHSLSTRGGHICLVPLVLNTLRRLIVLYSYTGSTIHRIAGIYGKRIGIPYCTYHAGTVLVELVPYWHYYYVLHWDSGSSGWKWLVQTPRTIETFRRLDVLPLAAAVSPVILVHVRCLRDDASKAGNAARGRTRRAGIVHCRGRAGRGSRTAARATGRPQMLPLRMLVTAMFAGVSAAQPPDPEDNCPVGCDYDRKHSCCGIKNPVTGSCKCPSSVIFSAGFDSDMVLQQAPAKAAVYGLAFHSGAAIEVTVTPSSGGAARTSMTLAIPLDSVQRPDPSHGIQSTTNYTAAWKVFLEPVDSGGTYTITSKCTSGCGTEGGERDIAVPLERVTFGLVFFCSGVGVNHAALSSHCWTHASPHTRPCPCYLFMCHDLAAIQHAAAASAYVLGPRPATPHGKWSVLQHPIFSAQHYPPPAARVCFTRRCQHVSRPDQWGATHMAQRKFCGKDTNGLSSRPRARSGMSPPQLRAVSGIFSHVHGVRSVIVGSARGVCAPNRAHSKCSRWDDDRGVDAERHYSYLSE